MAVSAAHIPRPRGEEGPTEHTDQDLLAALRAGDEELFLSTVRVWWPVMVTAASRYVSSRCAAEDVVQDTWVAVLQGLDRFEGRSSLRTWVFRILVNRARSAGVAERRVVPFSAGLPDEVLADEPSEPWLDADAAPTPEQAALSAELRQQLGAAVNRLPRRQRRVVLLRDVHGYPAEEVCRLLGVSTGNQRVLLHRGRAQLRVALNEPAVG